jgi:hypothetical protein
VNSATFVANALTKLNISAEVVKATDGNDVDKLVTEYNPTHVMIEAIWVTPEKLRELLNIKRHRNRRWVIRLHSRIPFIANEGIAFPWLVHYRELSMIWPQLIMAPNTEDFADDLRDTMGMTVQYLPNIYCPPDYGNCNMSHAKERNVINIGCFGAIRPMKNQLIQAVAAVKFANSIGKRVNFHMNGNRYEQKGEQVLKNIQAFFQAQYGHELILHDWMPHNEFIQLVKQMDVGMQVSFTETFNIVTADFVEAGVPIVGSPQIDWLPKVFQADPNSTNDICRVLAFTQGYLGSVLKYWSSLNLHKYNAEALRLWKKFLAKPFKSIFSSQS